MIRWSRAAAVQFFAAGDRIRRHRPSAADRLDAAVRRITERIAENPRLFARVEEVRDGEVRRALVDPFNYWIIYEVVDDAGQCLVLSFWSTRRDPQGWRRR